MLSVLSNTNSNTVLGHDRLILANSILKTNITNITYPLFVNAITNKDNQFIYLLFLNHYQCDNMGYEKYNDYVNQYNTILLTLQIIHQLPLDIDIHHILKYLYYILI